MRKGKSIILFSLGILCISLFLFVVIPFLSSNLASEKTEIIKNRDIDTGALLYSESEEALEGNFLLLKSN